MADRQMISNVLQRWDIQLADILPHLEVQGSPERSLFRTVISDVDGERFILEQLPSDVIDLKMGIADRIDRLAQKGLAVTPYRKGTDGSWIQRHCEYGWQLAPFITGAALDRQAYWNESWRGQATGRFLIQLHAADSDMGPVANVFDMPGYIDELVRRIGRHNPEAMPGVEPVASFLKQEFYPMLGDAPIGFSHGDPHPLNMIWGRDRILSVIDWEFCGFKPILYDAALIIGCVGAEAAEARHGGFIAAFLDTLAQDKMYSPKRLAQLPYFVLAVRFGWLSEWLRRQDREMIEFELFYMRLLLENCRTVE